MYKLVLFVPDEALEQVKDAMFIAGAGKIGNYQHCCWQVMGQGQFEPMPGSQPFIGEQGCLQRVAEWRVELVCADHCIHEVVAALKQAHPYEQPAYEVLALLDI